MIFQSTAGEPGEKATPKKEKKKVRRFLPLLLLVLLAAGIAFYTGDYYRADAAAERALLSDSRVQISKTDYGWFFDGPSDEEALIFYPGAKVEETAYSPLLHRLAEEGLDVCLVKMPLHLAFLDMNRAEKLMGSYDYPTWYIGGHSLGGACAAIYASGHGEALSGVLLLSAYPTKQLDKSLNILFVYGSEDGVLNREKYAENRHFAAENAVEVVIEGGNHAQFGSYGEQAGDGQAAIPAAVQVEETVEAVFAYLATAEG